MVQTLSIPSTTTSNQSKTPNAADAINDLDLNTFLKLMITELQQQDPLNPLDNKDMLNQIAQIRAVGASDKLTKTLDSVLLGQNIASATNLIGADISAITDDGESVTGIVSRISIDKGVPKLHVENVPSVAPSTSDGDIAAGTYSYRVVWQGEQGQLTGLDFSGNQAIKTTGTAGVDQSVQIRNLPVTEAAKYIYRTDKSGTGKYQLVGTVVDGSQGTFVDGLSDAERNGQTLTQSFQRAAVSARSYDVALDNVGAIRPPVIPNTNNTTN
jgi:flagellar basal-body rod modification protein FlgD